MSRTGGEEGGNTQTLPVQEQVISPLVSHLGAYFYHRATQSDSEVITTHQWKWGKLSQICLR